MVFANVFMVLEVKIVPIMSCVQLDQSKDLALCRAPVIPRSNAALGLTLRIFRIPVLVHVNVFPAFKGLTVA